MNKQQITIADGMGHQSWQKLTLTYFGKENQIICTANFLQIWDPFQIKKKQNNKVQECRTTGSVSSTHLCHEKRDRLKEAYGT